MSRTALAMMIAAVLIGAADEGFSPARYVAGVVPEMPVRALGGGQAFLELAIDESGGVSAVKPLRTTPPFTQDAAAAVRDWYFRPAEDDVLQRLADGRERLVRIAAPAKIFFASVFRAPVLNGFTLGAIPRDVAAPSPEIAWPINTVLPPYPPHALESGVVLLEARVGADGSISDVTVLHSSPPFDEAARDALKQWLFRPARRHGRNVMTFVYVAFGFPMPVT